MLRYLISIIAGLICSLGLLLILVFVNLWLVVLTVLIWPILLLAAWKRIEYFKQIRWQDLVLAVFTLASFVGLTVLIELEILRWLLVAIGGLIIAFLFFRLLKKRTELSYQQKPIRRMLVMLWVFNIYVFLTTVFAFDIFFQKIPFWLLSILSAVAAGFVSWLIWQMYFKAEARKFLLWMMLVCLLMVQITWVMHLLPLGYLTLGILATWVWYIIQLFIRFHLTIRDIVWKKQLTFLISNAVLFIILLIFVVRWI